MAYVSLSSLSVAVLATSFGFAQTNPMNLGGGTPGTTGIPHLHVSGSFLPGNNVTFHVENAAADASAFLVLGAGAVNVPYMGGILVPTPDLIFALTSNSAGGLGFSLAHPQSPLLFAQVSVVDAGSPMGLSYSNTVAFYVGPTPTSSLLQFHDDNGAVGSTLTLKPLRTGTFAGTIVLPETFTGAAAHYAWAYMVNGEVVVLEALEADGVDMPLVFQPDAGQALAVTSGQAAVNIPFGKASYTGVPAGSYVLRLWVCNSQVVLDPTTHQPNPQSGVVHIYDTPVTVTNPGFGVHVLGSRALSVGETREARIITAEPVATNRYFTVSATSPAMTLSASTAMIAAGETMSSAFTVTFPADQPTSGEIVAVRDDGVAVNSAFLTTMEDIILINHGELPNNPNAVVFGSRHLCVKATPEDWGKSDDKCGGCGNLGVGAFSTTGPQPAECARSGDFAPYKKAKCVDSPQHNLCTPMIDTLTLKFYEAGPTTRSKCGELKIDAGMKLKLADLGVTASVGTTMDLYEKCCKVTLKGNRSQQVQSCTN
jgi:hypothetical protein